MRYFIFLITLLALVSCQPAEQAGEEAAPEAGAEEAAADADPMDPTVSYADHYKVEFENEHVRVVRSTYAAEEEAGMHSHPDQVVVFLIDGSYTFVAEDGTEGERAGKAGEAIWAPAETHSGKALTDLEGILVEIKGGGEAEAAPEEASGESLDATEVAPDHYKAEFENDQVRVVRITYAAGEESGSHSHPGGVVVNLSDTANAAFVLEDGSSEERSGKAGEVRWAAAETHAAKALSDIEVLLVEIK